MEYFETFESCAAREVAEETNLSIEPHAFHILHAQNSIMQADNVHYVTIFMRTNIDDATNLRNMEPEKCDSWDWVLPENLVSGLKSPLFYPLEKLVKIFGKEAFTL